MGLWKKTPPATPGGDTFERLRRRYWDAIDPARAMRRRIVLWRELLALVRIGARSQHVALLLFDYADDTGRAHVSIRTLADDGRLSLAHVDRAVAELERVGILRSKGTREAAHYELNVQATTTASPAAGAR